MKAVRKCWAESGGGEGDGGVVAGEVGVAGSCNGEYVSWAI